MNKFEKILKFTQPLRHATSNVGEVEYRFTREAIEKLDQEAFERGRQDGEERVGQQMIELRKELAELQTGLFDTLRRAHQKVAEESEQALVEMTVAVAEKLVAGIEIDREQVTAALNEAVQQFEDCAEYEVLLHPDDLKLISDTDEAKNDQFRLQSSKDVSRGGCIVRTKFGAVDARRETKLTLLKESISR